MTPPEDSGYLQTLVGGLGAALAALGAWAWKHTHKRIDRVEAETNQYLLLSTFLENARARDQQLAAINESLSDHRRTTEKALDRVAVAFEAKEEHLKQIERENNERHIELLNAIYTLTRKQ